MSQTPRGMSIKAKAGGLISLGWLLGVTLVLADAPWSVQDTAPAMEAGETAGARRLTVVRPAVPDGFVKTGCYLWLRAYQTGFSRFSASKCPMHPSCSHYSLEAISRYGGFWGILMTADRLFHEGSVRYTAPWFQDVDRIRFVDPVVDNVIWRNNP